MNKELQGLLYHGSHIEVSKIDLLKCCPQKDFGIGFYTTISKQQAEKFVRGERDRYPPS